MDGLNKEIASIAESGSEEVAKACLKGLEEVLANARSLVARISQQPNNTDENISSSSLSGRLVSSNLAIETEKVYHRKKSRYERL